MAVETELKFTIGPQDVAKVKRALAAAARCRLSRRKLISTYFDTSDAAVERRRMSLGVRRQGRRFLQTVKSDGPYLTDRNEWEDPIRQPIPDLTARDSGTRLQALIGTAELKPFFTTTVSHSLVTLRPLPQTEIEAAIDEGQICVANGAACEPICELELELKSGEPAALYDVALRLLEVAPLQFEVRSKAERGYRLIGSKTKQPPIARAPSFSFAPNATVEVVLQEVGRMCLAHLVRNTPAALAGVPEAIHQMRVAVRRLRSALAGIKPMLPAEHYAWANGELKSLARPLGAPRNWDVFSDQLLRPVADAVPDQEDLTKLGRAVEKERRAAYEEARRIIRSPATTETILRLARWFEMRAWRDQPVSEQSVLLMRPMKEFAAGLIARRYKQARKRGKNFRSLSSGDRHRLRIALKKLRYSVELWGCLFDKAKVKAYVESLKSLQDELGYFSDVRTARTILAHLHRAGDNQAIRHAGGIVLGWHDRGLADRESKLRKQVRRFRRAKGFW